MVMRYTITGPVADGSYTSDAMNASYSRCELSYIRFFDSNGAQVTPSAGTVVFSGSPDGVNYRDIEGGSFMASSAYSGSRVPPYGEGLMVNARITLAGVAGASTFEAVVWRD